MSLWDNICQLMGCVIMDKLPALEMLTALGARYFLFGYHSQCNMNGNSLSNISFDTYLGPCTARGGIPESHWCPSFNLGIIVLYPTSTAQFHCILIERNEIPSKVPLTQVSIRDNSLYCLDRFLVDPELSCLTFQGHKKSQTFNYMQSVGQV